MSKNVTLYINDSDTHAVNRAKKLLAFHGDKSLSEAFVNMCEEVVLKYKPKEGQAK